MFRNLLAPILLLACAGGAAAADRAPAQPTEACLAAATSDSARADCIGETADACRAAIPNATPLDAALCINTETEWWQDRLGEAYDRMMKQAARLDGQHMDMIAKGAPRLTDDLGDIQASWRDWTEKRCTFDSMLMRGNPRRMVVVADCMLQQTAAQTLLLERGAGYYR
jgi:uncharacterized protein YecT (DUF1311 family)